MFNLCRYIENDFVDTGKKRKFEFLYEWERNENGDRVTTKKT
jgi:hypothetical protein